MEDLFRLINAKGGVGGYKTDRPNREEDFYLDERGYLVGAKHQVGAIQRAILQFLMSQGGAASEEAIIDHLTPGYVRTRVTTALEALWQRGILEKDHGQPPGWRINDAKVRRP